MRAYWLGLAIFGILSACSGDQLPVASNGGAPQSPGTAGSPAPAPAASQSPGATPTAAAEVTISIPQGSMNLGDRAYGENPRVITPGTTVTWVNDDTVPHTVTADDRSFDSKTLPPDARFTHKFDEPGSFPYFCEIHPNMKGVIQVR